MFYPIIFGNGDLNYSPLSFTDINTCDGDGIAIDLRLKANYYDPFILSMAIVTRTQSSGTIFQQHEYSNRISISWTSDSKLEFQLSNNNLDCCNGAIEEGINMHLTDVLSENQIYLVDLIYDGVKCKFHLNGNLIGSDMDCSNGFESVSTSPQLCSSSSSSALGRKKRSVGWNGSVLNVKFQGLKCK